MTLKIVIDVNLSPDWVDTLAQIGYRSVHWSAVGAPNARDEEIMACARSNNHIVFTHDLDFGTMLALTRATGPSVLQVRGQDVLPDHMGSVVSAALAQHEADLIAGALVVVDESRARVRLLPI